MSAASQCSETKHTSYHGEVRCDYPNNHDLAHAHYENGQLVVAWLTREEFEAAKARGEFDIPTICHCADPVFVCETCGGAQ